MARTVSDDYKAVGRVPGRCSWDIVLQEARDSQALIMCGIISALRHSSCVENKTKTAENCHFGPSPSFPAQKGGYGEVDTFEWFTLLAETVPGHLRIFRWLTFTFLVKLASYK